MVKYKGKDIVYSFKYSGLISRRLLTYIYISFFTVSLCLLCGIIAIIIEAGKVNSDSIAMSVIMIGFAIFGSLALAVDLWERRIEKKYKLWITDEGLIETTTIPFVFSISEHRGRTLYRFGITITVNGKEITKYNKNHDGFYTSHKNKPINILYSPKYDEVLIYRK